MVTLIFTFVASLITHLIHPGLEIYVVGGAVVGTIGANLLLWGFDKKEWEWHIL